MHVFSITEQRSLRKLILKIGVYTSWRDVVLFFVPRDYMVTLSMS